MDDATFPFLPEGLPVIGPGKEAGFEELVEKTMAQGGLGVPRATGGEGAPEGLCEQSGPVL